jgi:hypothetical protein
MEKEGRYRVNFSRVDRTGRVIDNDDPGELCDTIDEARKRRDQHVGTGDTAWITETADDSLVD